MEINPSSNELSSTPVKVHSESAPATGSGNFGRVLGAAVTVESQLASKVAGAQTMGLGPIAGSLLNGGVGGVPSKFSRIHFPRMTGEVLVA